MLNDRRTRQYLRVVPEEPKPEPPGGLPVVAWAFLGAALWVAIAVLTFIAVRAWVPHP